ncbi:MAG TPA: hypothetical protein VFY29_12200 [Terriglobia bacterium]|nr:hypothetical protein [Terriglobia bacterium]
MFSMTAFVVVTVLVALECTVSFAQDEIAQTNGYSSIRLLPGYHHHVVGTFDGAAGTIGNEKGFVLRYDIGCGGGNYVRNAKQQERTIWVKEQILGDMRIESALVAESDSEPRRLLVTLAAAAADRTKPGCGGLKTTPGGSGPFPANFSVAVKGEEDIVDAMLMIMTYRQVGEPPPVLIRF